MIFAQLCEYAQKHEYTLKQVNRWYVIISQWSCYKDLAKSLMHSQPNDCWVTAGSGARRSAEGCSVGGEGASRLLSHGPEIVHRRVTVSNSVPKARLEMWEDVLTGSQGGSPKCYGAAGRTVDKQLLCMSAGQKCVQCPAVVARQAGNVDSLLSSF